MEDNSRFLIAEQDVPHFIDGKFIIDIPLNRGIKAINGFLILATDNNLTKRLLPQTKLFFMSDSFGLLDFREKSKVTTTTVDTVGAGGKIIRTTTRVYGDNAIHEIADLFELASQQHFLATDPLNINNAPNNPDRLAYYELHALNADIYVTSALQLYFKCKVLSDDNKIIENAGKYFATLPVKTHKDDAIWDFSNGIFDEYISRTFESILSPNEIIKFAQIDIPYRLDKNFLSCGNISISLNSAHLVLRNYSVILNRSDNSLRNNLIDVGSYKCNGGFIRCTFISDSMWNENNHPTSNSFKVKIYIKYEKS